MSIKNDLKSFYDQEAKKYYLSRNKHRSDGNIILEYIKKYNKKNISILEFWCWWWRCIKFLNENLKGIKINYTWVDLSKNLLNYAQKDNPKDKFICDDITNFIKTTKQESFDFIIWIASFQHIWNKKERLYLMKRFYKSLKYWWKIIMTNWSFSLRFIKKFKKPILKSIFKSMYTLGQHSRNDLYIPRINEGKKEQRYYHIFQKNELKRLCNESWFVTDMLTYLDKTWHKTDDRKKSNNTILVWNKEVFL